MAAATTEGPQSMIESKIGRPAMKQPSFNWEADDKYSGLKNFRLEVNNMISSYNTPHAEQLVIVKNWLGRKGLQFIKLLMSHSDVGFHCSQVNWGNTSHLHWAWSAGF